MRLVPPLAELGLVVALGGGVPGWAPAAPQQPGPGVPPAPAMPQQAEPARAVLAGRVTAAESGEPLVRARIVVRSPALAGARVVLTGPDGRYRVAELPAGSYTVVASKSGFVPETRGAETGPGGVALAEGEERSDVDFELSRAGVVSGRIRDEDGSPLEGARVEVWRTGIANGQRVLSVVGRATADDRGRFRVGGLPPGFYLVSAADPAWDAAADPVGPLSYAPTYYPGVAFPDAAARVSVQAGRETPGIEFTVRVVRPVRVSGRLIAYDDRPLVAGAITLTAEGLGRTVAPVGLAAGDVVIWPDGRFSFRNVIPGRYVIRARGQTEPGGTPLFGTFSAVLEGTDLDKLTIVLSPGGTVEGGIELERSRGVPPLTLSGLRVRAVAADGVAFADALSELADRDGRFVVRGVMPGRYVFRVEGLPESWVLKAVTLRGLQVVDLPVALESGERVEALRIVLSDAPSGLAGVVRGTDGRPRPGGSVVVFAVDPGLWTPYTRHVRVARVGKDGRYRLSALPPGDYWVVPTEEVISGADLDVPGLERLAARGMRLRIREGEPHTLDLVAASDQPSSSYSPSAGGAKRVDGRNASR